MRRYTTVKEVRLHSERGKAAQWPGWLKQSPPCPAAIWESLRLSRRGTGVVRWKPCPDRVKRRWRPSPGGVGRDRTYARGRGGRARRLCPSPRGVGRGETCARGQGVGRAAIWGRDRGDRYAGARVTVIADGSIRLLQFLLLWFGYPFYGTQHHISLDS